MKFFLKKARGGRRAAGGGAAPRVAARVLQLIRNAPVYKALAKHPPHAAQATILYVLQHSREDARLYPLSQPRLLLRRRRRRNLHPPAAARARARGAFSLRTCAATVSSHTGSCCLM